MSEPVVYQRPQHEVADVILAAGSAYRKQHALSHHQHKVLNAISSCRTAALGGHLERCDHCEFERPVYNSCRNRHCPKCQGLDNLRWVQEREAELLPIQYFHIVFTLPHEWNLLAQYNSAAIYDLLFRSATATLQQFADNKWRGKLGISCVLHTWGQQLQLHIHLHCIVTGGVLTHDNERWINAPKNYLFKVENLGKVFRGKFCKGLQQLAQCNALHYPPTYVDAQTEDPLSPLLEAVYLKPWVVYSKAPFADPEAVLKYLSRYTHRIAISNHRIQAVTDTAVTFQYKDYADDGQVKLLSLTSAEFIRRFLLHLLPKAYVRIRHYGLLAGRNRKAKLAHCRAIFQLPLQSPPKARQTALELLQTLTGHDPLMCPRCQQGRLHNHPLSHDPPQSLQAVPT